MGDLRSCTCFPFLFPKFSNSFLATLISSSRGFPHDSSHQTHSQALASSLRQTCALHWRDWLLLPYYQCLVAEIRIRPVNPETPRETAASWHRCLSLRIVPLLPPHAHTRYFNVSGLGFLLRFLIWPFSPVSKYLLPFVPSRNVCSMSYSGAWRGSGS